jgi:hypothetical protein
VATQLVVYRVVLALQNQSVVVSRRCYINISMKTLDIFHPFLFYLKLDISENRFFLGLQVEHTQLGPINKLVSVSRKGLERIVFN